MLNDDLCFFYLSPSLLKLFLLFKFLCEMSLRWTYKLSPDWFQCKEQRCEAYNDRICVDFKHRPSTLNNLGRCVFLEFNLKDWQTCCCNGLKLVSYSFSSILFYHSSLFVSSIVVCIYAVDDNFIFTNTMFFVRFTAEKLQISVLEHLSLNVPILKTLQNATGHVKKLRIELVV